MVGGLSLVAAAAVALACGRPVAVEVAPSEPAGIAARGVQPLNAWTLTSADPVLGELAWLDHAAGEARTSAGRRLGWRMAGEQPGAFRADCPAPPASAVPAALPPDPPRIRGYRYVGARPLPASAFRWLGLWRANEGPEETLVVAFDASARTVFAPYVVLVRTPEPLGAVSAAGERRALHLDLAAVSRAAPGAPVRLTTWRWRGRAMSGVPLD